VAYCGTFSADDQTDSGTFSIVLAGSILSGEAVSSTDGTHQALDGIVSGNAITIYFPGTTTPLATGTRNGSSVSGTYDDGQGGREARERGAGRCASKQHYSRLILERRAPFGRVLPQESPGTRPGRFAFRGPPLRESGSVRPGGGCIFAS
jgi:hypothetical protein